MALVAEESQMANVATHNKQYCQQQGKEQKSARSGWENASFPKLTGNERIDLGLGLADLKQAWVDFFAAKRS